MSDVFDILSLQARAKLKRKPRPAWVSPMLATLTDRPFSDPAWLYERKLDGVRCLLFRGGDRVRLMSRNKKPLDAAYPELHEAIAQQRAADFIADGEVVAFEGEATSFSRLQGRLGLRDAVRARATGIEIHLYLFDLIYADGHDLTRLSVVERKAVLNARLKFNEPLRYSEHRTGDGEAFLNEACASGWEGLIAKRIGSTYQSSRSRDWLKLKCTRRQEFIIIGFTDPQGSRLGFGSLLLGYYERGRLRYAGRVGTGFNDRLLRALHARLQKIERADPPVDDPERSLRRAHWVEPKLVGEVAFTEWTPDGRLRHPAFLGLREDKPARQVVRERVS